MIRLFEDNNVLDYLDKEIGVSRWIDVTQQRITEFGHVTEDPDRMHIDPEWAAVHSPFGKTFAFGFLTVALLTRMVNDIVARPTDELSTLNYGFDRLRMLSPVLVDSRIRGHLVLKALSLRSPTQFRAVYAVTVEVEGSAKPALVADWLSVTNVANVRQPLRDARALPGALA
jgi:acyl dehydratase